MLAEMMLAAALFITAAADDTLDVAKVSAERNPVLTSSAPVRRITAGKIARSGCSYLHEAVRTFAGVSVKDYGGIGGLKTVSVRNMGAAHTAVCYDGVTVSDAQNGQVDIGRFGLENVDEVSVVIGQDDEIFRSARLSSAAGVLHIRTAKPSPDAPSVFRAGVSAASFSTCRTSLHYSAGIGGGFAVSADASFLSSAGDYPYMLHNGNVVTREIRQNGDVVSGTGEVGIYGILGENGRGGTLTAKANLYMSERGLPGSVVLYTANPVERLWDRNAFASMKYEGRFGSAWRLEAGLSYTYSRNRHTDSSPLYSEPQDDRYLQQEGAFSAVCQYAPSDLLRFVLAEDVFINVLDSDIPECPYPRRMSSLTAFSAQYSGDALEITAGILGTAVSERALKGDAAPDRLRLSPSASVSYAIPSADGLRLRASYRDSYRVPTFNDLYYARVGNVNLKPEKATQFNVGITWGRTGRLGAGITADAYLNLIRDKIVAVPTMFIWKMHNVGRARLLGTDITASLSFRAYSWLALYADLGWSFQYAVDVTDPQAKNWKHQIPYTPRHTGNGVVSAETPWFTVTYNVAAVGRRYALAQNIPSNAMDGYADHGLSLGREFHIRKVTLRLGVEVQNIGNVNYEVIRYYPMAGRSYRIRLNMDI